MRIPRVRELYVDEAEGFLLEHALFSPPRTWPPLPSEETQSARLQSKAKKMDWEGESRKVNLENDADDVDAGPSLATGDHASEGESNKERCVICLMELRDRTIVGVCGHEFCFECIGVWANQSRRCPLCSADMAPFLLHDLDNAVPTKHIGSNAETRYRPNPTPHEIANSPALIQRATAFLRRELRVWSHADVEQLTSHILSLIKAVDIRSDVAIRLLAEFLNPPPSTSSIAAPLAIPNGAEHFAHELYCWLRSPFKELRQWDLVAQYDSVNQDDTVEAEPYPPRVAEKVRNPSLNQHPKGRSYSRASSRSPSRSPNPSRSRSRSPYYNSSRSHSLHSRSLSPRKSEHHVFIPSNRAWDQGDFWVDPEYAEEQAAKRRKIHQSREDERTLRQAQRREIVRDRNGMRMWGAPPAVSSKNRIELLPDNPEPEPPTQAEIEASAVQLNIRGAAVVAPSRPSTLTLKQRLDRAKAEASGLPDPYPPSPAPVETALPVLPDNPAEINAEDLLGSTSPTSPTMALDMPRRSVSGLKETVRARLRLRLKLESERAKNRQNVAESKAQELRRILLEAKVTRQAAETDAVFRRMDRLDRQKEVRRRLMVAKMMQAETEGEKRARELKERLSADKRRKMLREVLLARKRAGEGDVVGLEA